jgi:hypothetical protein
MSLTELEKEVEKKEKRASSGFGLELMPNTTSS